MAWAPRCPGGSCLGAFGLTIMKKGEREWLTCAAAAGRSHSV